MVIKSFPVKILAGAGAFLLGVAFFFLKQKERKRFDLHRLEPVFEPDPPAPLPRWQQRQQDREDGLDREALRGVDCIRSARERRQHQQLLDKLPEDAIAG